jgi:hypothetical protein
MNGNTNVEEVTSVVQFQTREAQKIAHQRKIHDYTQAQKAKAAEEKGEQYTIQPFMPDTVEDEIVVMYELLQDVWREHGPKLRQNYSSEYKLLKQRIEQFDASKPSHLAKQELTLIAETVAQHPAIEESEAERSAKEGILAEFNKHHALVIYGGKAAIYRDDHGDFIDPNEMVTFFSDKTILVNGKPQNAVRAWLDWPKARRYEKIVFNPSITGHYENKFNMWTGFAVQPEEGDDDLPFWELLEATCGYHQPYVEYVTMWIADIIGNPARNPGVALGISAGQGTGKTTFADTIGKLLGSAYITLSIERFLHEFNEISAYKMLVFLDETTWGGSHRDAQKLKAAITQTYENINPKGRKMITVDCYRRLIMASNSEFYTRVDKDDRRILPLEPDTSKINTNSTEFWTGYYEKLNSGKMLANLLHRLQGIDVSGFNPQQEFKKLEIVSGKALIESSKEPWEHWLEAVAETGLIHLDKGAERIVESSTIDDKELETAFDLWAKDKRINVSWLSDRFKKARVRVFGDRIRDGRKWNRKIGTCAHMLEKLNEGYRWKV